MSHSARGVLLGMIIFFGLACERTSEEQLRHGAAEGLGKPNRNTEMCPDAILVLSARLAIESELNWTLVPQQDGRRIAINSMPNPTSTINGEPAAFLLDTKETGRWRLRVTAKSPTPHNLTTAVRSTIEISEKERRHLLEFKKCFVAITTPVQSSAPSQSALRTAAFELTHRIGRNGLARNEPASDAIVEFYTILLEKELFGVQAWKQKLSDLRSSVQQSPDPEVIRIREGFTLASEILNAESLNTTQLKKIESWCEPRANKYDEVIKDGTNALIALLAAYPFAEKPCQDVLTRHEKLLAESLLAGRSRPSHWLIAEQLSQLPSWPVSRPSAVAGEVTILISACDSRFGKNAQKTRVMLELTPEATVDVAEITVGPETHPSIVSMETPQE